jgi:hypothetical protein
MKRLENAGAYAAELELVPHKLASYFCKKTSLLLMSLGSGSGCDTQFLFSDDILQRQAEIDLPTNGELYRLDVNHPDTNGMMREFIVKNATLWNEGGWTGRSGIGSGLLVFWGRSVISALGLMSAEKHTCQHLRYGS